MKVGENYQQICLYFIEYMCEILLNKYKALKRLKRWILWYATSIYKCSVCTCWEIGIDCSVFSFFAVCVIVIIQGHQIFLFGEFFFQSEVELLLQKIYGTSDFKWLTHQHHRLLHSHCGKRLPLCTLRSLRWVLWTLHSICQNSEGLSFFWLPSL